MMGDTYPGCLIREYEMLSILGFGSLIYDPGPEIQEASLAVRPTVSPFPVEYARQSIKRKGAPTLVRCADGGQVIGVLFVMRDEITEAEASTRLWRRETGKIGTGQVYTRPPVPLPTSFLVEHVQEGDDRILYSDFIDESKLTTPTGAALTDMAIASVKDADPGMDGISYLMGAIEAGIVTPLTPEYVQAILHKTGEDSLEAALAKVKTGTAPPPSPEFDAQNPSHRAALVRRVRERFWGKFGKDWKRRCADTAALTLLELRMVGLSYRIAAGKAVETELAPAVTGRERLIRYEGGYSGTGRSEYHAWLVNPAGEKIDCSELPIERYKRRFVWEPSEPIPEVDYTELPADTASVLSKARKIGYPI
jgi:hypothetical protein